MKNNTSRDAYYERLKNLASVNKASVKESQTRNLGTLIDYKRASDNIAYGIIKENHNYYIKKAGLKSDPTVADFAYIGGLSNITNYQFKSLAEADKQRNMLLHTVTEATSLKPNPNGGKRRINEDKAGEEIGSAEAKLGDLDAATAAEETPQEPTPDEMAAGIESEPPSPEGEEGMPAPEGEEGMPAPEGGEMPDMGGEEAPEDGGETPAPEGGEGEDEGIKELEKAIGKLTNTIRKTDLEPSQVKSYVNSYLAAFKDKFPELEIEDRKEMANRILKVVPPEDIEGLGQNIEDSGDAAPAQGDEQPEMAAEEVCAECGSFAKYAESRGYDSADALMECGEEETTNLVSGYANAHNDGMNDGDLENVALVIKIINPKMLDNLKGDYGHDEYANKLEPIVTGMNESTDEENVVKLQELFGGLGGAMKHIGSGIGSAAQKAGQAIGGAVQKGAQAVGGAAQKAGQAVGQAAKGVQQAYHTAEVPAEVKKLEGLANDLGKQIASLNTRLTKAGKQPVNVNGMLMAIKNQVGVGKSANVGGRIAEEGFDPAGVEVQPNLRQEGIAFGKDSQNLGAGVVKPLGAPITMSESKKLKGDLSKEEKAKFVKKAIAGKDIDKKDKDADKKDKSVEKKGKDVKKVEKAPEEVMTESEIKLRKYIREQLKVKAGEKKATINESEKSTKLHKLDSMIAEQIELYKDKEVKKKVTLNEMFGLSVKEKFAKLDKNDADAVNKLFRSVYSEILTSLRMSVIGTAANRLSTEEKYELIKKYAENGEGTLRISNGKVVFAKIK